MRSHSLRSIGLFVSALLASAVPFAASAQKPQATVFFSPARQSVIEGSTFDVSVYLDTHKTSINAVQMTIKFPPSKLQIVSPSSGKSLVQVWLAPPSYSQTEGTIRFEGIIPNGVVTQSGLLTTVTFKAIASGDATLSIAPSSRLYINDGLATEAAAEFGRGTYSITPQPPVGVRVFSDTHPFESVWYQNKNAVIGWDGFDPGTTFSYQLDDKPTNTPDDVAETADASLAYHDLEDGLHYFHIKASKEGIWGATTNFLIRVDTIPPASFQPATEIVSNKDTSRYLISFLTTDSLSGVDHYEVAVIDKTESATISPVFVQADSPYQLSNPSSHPLRVIVRAVDGAGNIRDQSIDLDVAASMTPGAKTFAFLKTYLVAILSGLLGLLLFLLLLHYLFGHHIYSRMKKVSYLMEHESEVDRMERQIHDETNPPPPPPPTLPG